MHSSCFSYFSKQPLIHFAANSSVFLSSARHTNDAGDGGLAGDSAGDSAAGEYRGPGAGSDRSGLASLARSGVGRSAGARGSRDSRDKGCHESRAVTGDGGDHLRGDRAGRGAGSALALGSNVNAKFQPIIGCENTYSNSGDRGSIGSSIGTRANAADNWAALVNTGEEAGDEPWAVAQAGNVVDDTAELGSLLEHGVDAISLSPRLVSTRDYGKKAMQVWAEAISTYSTTRQVAGNLLSDQSRRASEGEDGSDGTLHGDGVIGNYGSTFFFLAMIDDER